MCAEHSGPDWLSGKPPAANNGVVGAAVARGGGRGFPACRAPTA